MRGTEVQSDLMLAAYNDRLREITEQQNRSLAGPGTRRLWWPPAVGVLLTAFATYLIYPVAYGEFLGGEPWMVAVGAVRNLALVVLLMGAVWRIVQLGLRDPARLASSPAPG